MCLFKADSEDIEQENVTVTSAYEFEFTTRTNRTNRLEVLEEYYNNSTNEDQLEEKTAMEIKEIVLLSTNTSYNEDSNRTNVTIVEEIGKKNLITLIEHEYIKDRLNKK